MAAATMGFVVVGVNEGTDVVDFAALAEAEQPALLRLAVRLLRDAEDARDLVQLALADAFERRHTLRDAAAARGWLRRILVTRGLNQLRRRRAWRRVRALFGAESGGPEPVVHDPAPDVAIAQRRSLEDVARALDRLPARQAAAFTLRYLEGLDVDAVAAALGVGRGTAKTHLRRALLALRGALSKVEGG